MKNKITIAAFLLMLAVFTVMLSLPADKESVEKENRPMSTMPALSEKTLFSGELASGVESVIGDNIGFRSFFTGLSSSIDNLKGFVPETGEIISTNKDIGTGTTQKQTLLLADNTIMEMFIRNNSQEELYAQAVNRYARTFGDNIKLYSMLIPTQLSFREPMYKNLQDDQQEVINSIYEKLDQDVTAVDAYSALESHSDEYIYFRTDHHWTQLGAYYAYKAFMEAAGSRAADKDDYEQNKIPGVLGYLYDKVNRAEIASQPDTIEWFDINKSPHIFVKMYNETLTPYNGVMYDRSKASYDFFFGSDHPVTEMVNENNLGGKTIVVLKESYANVFAPWLIESYHRVVLVDPRIYEGDFQTITDNFAPDELLIMNYVFTTNFPDYCALMDKMCQ